MTIPPEARTESGAFCPVAGGRVWYRVIGDGPGTPLLCAHGGPGATHHYIQSHGILGDERPVILWDQLESGASDKPNDPSLWTLPRFVSEVDSLRAHLGLERVILLGSSWGGALATTYAGGNPAGLVACVLSSPFIHARTWVADNAVHVANLPPHHAEAIARNEAAGTTDAPDYLAALDVFYARHLCRTQPMHPDMVASFDRLNHAVYNTMNGPSEFTVIGTLRDMDCTPALAHIACPTLFTCGEFDEAAPESVRRFAAMVPGAQVAVFPDASHTPHLETPEPYFARLRAFLTEADRG